eukprot:jgi/Bigna1/68889/fgenesh1_pg.7_\
MNKKSNRWDDAPYSSHLIRTCTFSKKKGDPDAVSGCSGGKCSLSDRDSVRKHAEHEKKITSMPSGASTAKTSYIEEQNLGGSSVAGKTDVAGAVHNTNPNG